jgi:hypothetical protein
MQTRNAPATNTANERSLSSDRASSPSTSRTDSGLPAACGGVCGSTRAYSPITTDAPAAMRIGAAVASSPNCPTTRPAAIHPMVPSTRTSGNSLAWSVM